MSAQHNDPTADDIAALLRRADRAVAEGGLRERTKYFWNGYRKALEDLANGTGRRLAAKDRLTHQAMSLLQGAKPTLPEGLEVLAAVDVPQGLAAESVKASRDAVPHLKINGVQQLEHGEIAVAAADLKGEVAHAGVEPDDGSDRHVASISGQPHRPLNVDVWHLIGEQGTGKSVYARQFAKALLEKADLRAIEIDAYDLGRAFHGRIDLALKDLGEARVVMISHALSGLPGTNVMPPHWMAGDRVVLFSGLPSIGALCARAIWATKEYVARCIVEGGAS